MSSYRETEVRRLIAEAMVPLHRRIAALETRVVELETENAALKAANGALQAEVARLKKNSSNSSKPPSSDIVKPPKPAGPRGRKRKIGGQPGHEGHFREPFATEEIDRVAPYKLTTCPDCGGKLTPAQVPPRVVQTFLDGQAEPAQSNCNHDHNHGHDHGQGHDGACHCQAHS